MSDSRVFYQLPVELLHTIFNYFSASELLFTFLNVNNYVNGTLQSYSDYHLDLRSISKSHFRQICRHIRPEQVISLTLSDGDDTPGLSDAFISYFLIEQFIRLRSLTLTEIEVNSLKFIFVNLPQLHQLRSFTFDTYSIRYTYRLSDRNFHDKFEQIKSMLRDTYAQVFPRLNFLSLSDGCLLESWPLLNLLHLKLKHCPVDKLETIINLAPKLRSLDIDVNFVQKNFEVFLLPSQLTRLRLKIQNSRVSMDYMYRLLSKCFHLKHLELHLEGLSDLANGEHWKSLTNNLITFNFKIDVHLHLCKQTLDSFRTSFWLEEKRWFVAYQNECLFSVPYFSPTEVSTFYRRSIYSTVSNDGILHKNVIKLIMDDPRIHLMHFKCPILENTILCIIDFCNLKSLSILSLDDLLEFTPIKLKIPQLSQLSIRNKITIKQLKRMINNSYEQISTLEINSSIAFHDYMIHELFRLFPYVERFIYKPIIESIALMTRFIEGFKHLSSASFISRGRLNNEDQKFRLYPHLMILEVDRLAYGISVCRIYHLPNNSCWFGIHWWVAE